MNFVHNTLIIVGLSGRLSNWILQEKDFESKQLIKKEQVGFLKSLADTEDFLIDEIPADWIYLTEGGESKVYLHPDQHSVVKLNDAAYYATWLEYFNSLVIHNLLFPIISIKSLD